MEIRSRFKTYQVDFVESVEPLEKLSRQPESFFVIDRVVYELQRETFPPFPKGHFFLLDAVEDQKTMRTALAICEQMTALSSKRNTHLISIGGGITQDVTGFVATSLYRGIPWTFYPTTLLAACDSCIGGKSSLNYKGFKNLLGTFYPPDSVHIYPIFYQTLSVRDYCSGLGEVVKFHVIAGQDGFTHLERDIEALIAHDYTLLKRYILSSLKFKKKFIEEDEFDQGIRILLNFAHTFGHAYEVVSNYSIPHGLAVALGMMTANYISMKRGFLMPEYIGRIEQVCKKLFMGTEIQASWFQIEGILAAIRKDKKQVGNEMITAVLIQEGDTLGVFHDVREQEVAAAVTYVVSLMSYS